MFDTGKKEVFLTKLHKLRKRNVYCCAAKMLVGNKSGSYEGPTFPANEHQINPFCTQGIRKRKKRTTNGPVIAYACSKIFLELMNDNYMKNDRTIAIPALGSSTLIGLDQHQQCFIPELKLTRNHPGSLKCFLQKTNLDKTLFV